MFGPLPLLHRIVLIATTLFFGVTAGAWVAHLTSLPVAVSVGALVGGCVGLLASYPVVHASQPRPARFVRRR
jgi:hypothetical protein